MYHLRGLLLFCCLLSLAFCQDYQDVDSRPQSRLRTARGPIVPNRAAAKQAVATKTSTTPEPEPEYEDVVYEDEEQLAPATTTTSTEPPKKGIRGGVVRPFRSNTDLIEALKRRRAQASQGGNGNSNGGSSTTTSTTEQSQQRTNGRKSKGSERKFSRGGDRGERSTSTEPPAEESPQRSRIFSGRGRRF
uniref:Putative conserved secreted protein n=1 Tax=Panstrongylus lignarius TaxID=156445 RepID=A0A224XQB3_9HEMI